MSSRAIIYYNVCFDKTIRLCAISTILFSALLLIISGISLIIYMSVSDQKLPTLLASILSGCSLILTGITISTYSCMIKLQTTSVYTISA